MIKYQVRISEEDEARAAVHHIVYGGLLDVGHVAKDGEDQHACQQAREGVHNAGDDGIPEKIWKILFTQCKYTQRIIQNST